MVLTGLTMSPGHRRGVPWLLDLFGGRQSARTIHFIAAALIVLFVIVHVVMVLISGVWNNMRSMITGRYAIDDGRRPMRTNPDRAAAASCAAPAPLAGTLALGGCDALVAGARGSAKILDSAEERRRCGRSAFCLALRRRSRANYTEADLSPKFKANGIDVARRRRLPGACRERLRRLAAEGRRPGRDAARVSRSPISAPCRRARRSRATTASRAGAASANGRASPLAHVLEQAGAQAARRATSSSTAPTTLEQTLDGTGHYYESIGLEDAFHPQTILAYEMNDRPLPIPHGAPLRLRVERQLGYKMAKYVMRIEAVESFAAIGRRQGRLLGRPRLRMVRGDLTGLLHSSADCSLFGLSALEGVIDVIQRNNQQDRDSRSEAIAERCPWNPSGGCCSRICPLVLVGCFVQRIGHHPTACCR